MSTQRVVSSSGGIGSWAVAHKVAKKHGTDNLKLVFCDTKYEDEDLYRFNAEASAQLGVPLTVIADGRTPWQVFNDKRYIGNTRIAPCSQELKQIPFRKWLEANCDPADTVIYVGIDWSESHRIPPVRSGYAHTMAGCKSVTVHKGTDDEKTVRVCGGLFDEDGRLPGPGCPHLLPDELAWKVEFPLAEPPCQDKDEWLAEARSLGLTPTRMYDLGFPHANCGGRCIKGGKTSFEHLLKIWPKRFAEVEAEEAALQAKLGTDATILRDRRGGRTVPLPLPVLRRRAEARGEQGDLFDGTDWGGCGCFTDGVTT